MKAIPYRATKFPPTVLDASKAPDGAVHVNFAGLARAALTVSRSPAAAAEQTWWPPIKGSFASLWRVGMLMEYLSPHGGRWRRSSRFDQLDMSEQAAVTFFLSQVQAKVFAEKLFGIVEFVHVDAVLARQGLPRARTRPDFIGYDRAGNVAAAVEVKGRKQLWRATTEQAAKEQAQALPVVLGYPTTAYAQLAYFASSTWAARLVDPPSQRLETVRPDEISHSYYTQLADTFFQFEDVYGRASQTGLRSDSHEWVHVPELHLSFGLTREALRRGLDRDTPLPLTEYEDEWHTPYTDGDSDGEERGSGQEGRTFWSFGRDGAAVVIELPPPWESRGA